MDMKILETNNVGLLIAITLLQARIHFLLIVYGWIFLWIIYTICFFFHKKKDRMQEQLLNSLNFNVFNLLNMKF